MATQTVSINFLANATQAQTAINHLQSNLHRLGRTAGGGKTALGALAGGAARLTGIVGALGAAYMGFAMAVKGASNFVGVNRQFQDAMLELKAVVQEDGGDVAANLEYLEYVARKAGKDTRYSAIKGAEGLRELAKAGKDAKEAGDMLVPTLHMAQTGGLELGDAAEKLADVMSAFNKDSSEAAEVVDILAFTAAKSTTDIQQMMEAFKYVSAAGGGMGQTLKDISIGIGVLSSMGVKASMAGTALRGTLVQLADTGSRAHKDLLALGLTTEDILPSATNTLIDIMRKARDHGLNAGNAYAIFGQRAGVAANVFTQFYERLEEFDDSMVGVEGAAERMANTMDEGLTTATLKLQNAWSELMLVLGTGAPMRALVSVIRTITDTVLMAALAIEIMKNAFEAGDLGNLLFSSIMSAVIPAVNYLYAATQSVFHTFFSLVASSFSILASPMFWEGIWTIFQGSGQVMLEYAYLTMAYLTNEVGTFLLPLIAGFDYIRNMLVGAFYTAVAIYYENIHPAVESYANILRTIWTWVSGVASWVVGLQKDYWAWVLGRVSTIQKKFVEIGSSLVSKAIEFGRKLWEYIRPLADFFDIEPPGFLDDMSDVSRRAGEVIWNTARSALTKINPLASDMKDSKANSARDKANKALGSTLSGSFDKAASKLGDVVGGLRDKAALAGHAGRDNIALGDRMVQGARERARRDLDRRLEQFSPKMLMDPSRYEKMANELVLKHMPKPPKAPDGKDGSGSGQGGGGDGLSRRDGALRALAGANASAINAIMGRTANELIAQEASSQTKLMKQTLDETKSVKEELRKLNDKKPAKNYSTFE